LLLGSNITSEKHHTLSVRVSQKKTTFESEHVEDCILHHFGPRSSQKIWGLYLSGKAEKVKSLFLLLYKKGVFFWRISPGEAPTTALINYYTLHHSCILWGCIANENEYKTIKQVTLFLKNYTIQLYLKETRVLLIWASEYSTSF
jgi:hypothetical protein